MSGKLDENKREYWKPVFEIIKDRSGGSVDLDVERAELESDGASGDHDDCTVVAIFVQDGKRIRIRLETTPTHGSIDKVEYTEL